MQAGDHFGFMWKNYGVVSFTWLDEDDHGRYCEKEMFDTDLGISLSLEADRADWREYYIQFHYCCKLLGHTA